MKRWVLFLICLTFSLNGFTGDGDSAASTYCKTKYPIVLSYHWGGTVDGTIHNGKPTSGRLGSFNLGMIEAMEARGAVVHVADKYDYETKSRYETIKYRAKKLAVAIVQLLKKTRPGDWDEAVNGKWKVNIIGHSMGAVDARYMIAKLNAEDGTPPMHELVATFTSLSGAHGGTRNADLAVWYRSKLVGKELNDKLEELLLPYLCDNIQEVLGNKGFWPSVEDIKKGARPKKPS